MEKLLTPLEIFDKNAQLYQEKYMDVGLYEKAFDRFCEAVPEENPVVLDIACGPGNVTRYLLKKRPDFKVLGIDLSPKMIELASINNPAASFKVMDCRDISSLSPYYQGIMCGFCLPYLDRTAAVQLIRDVFELLNEGGVFFLSTMEGPYEQSGIQTASTGEKLFMYFHPGDEIAAAMQETGFVIREMIRQDFPSADGAKTIDLCILAQK